MLSPELVGGSEASMAINRQLLPPPSKDFNDAKRQYMEQYGSALVTNSYLRIAVLCLSLVAAGTVLLSYKTYSTFQNVKPLIIRINDVGRAEAVQYNAMEYTPREAELKYFLTQFVHDFYSRNRMTVRDDFSRSLYFLERQLAESKMEQNRKTKEIESFLVGADDEVEVNIRNIIIHDLRKPPYRATVDFEKVFLTGPARAERRREKYVGSVVFSIRDVVPNNLVPINPLGIMINYFREDQAFGAEPTR
jgi:type IV secretory pathway TrbF-like protein